jgi:hypothetical protein
VRILFIADVIGKGGRRAVRALLPGLRGRGVDLVVANGENLARGLGVTPKLAREMFNAGVDVLTTGNHLFRRREIAEHLPEEPRILRPANFRARAPGKGWYVAETTSGVRVGVLNLVGQLFMDPAGDPVAAGEEILDGPLASVPIRLLDFHAEATGEKRGLAHWFDGRLSALVGTHTHVQTADEHVSARGTAYISDAGLTGDPRSVIGMDPEVVLRVMRTGVPERYDPAVTDIEVQGVMVDVDDETGRAVGISRVREPHRPDKEQER